MTPPARVARRRPASARLLAFCLLALAALLHGEYSAAADVLRGSRLFSTPPAAGQLACIDCHSASPQVTNFGNIFVGHNAPALIQRAVTSNVGGMGYFGRYFAPADFADVAAYLGNWPGELNFGQVSVGEPSARQIVTVSSSTRTPIQGLSVSAQGDFRVVGGSCGPSVPRFSRCTLDIAFVPTEAGVREGALLIAHDGTPTPVRILLAGFGTPRPPAVAELRPSALSFGATAVGGPGPVKTVVLSNRSDEWLTVREVRSSVPDFTVLGGDCLAGRRLGPGQRCAVSLRFQPTTAGASRGELVITHNGVGERSVVQLDGLADVRLTRGLTPGVSQLDFGSGIAGQLGPTHSVVFVNEDSSIWRWANTRVTAPGMVIVHDGCQKMGTLPPRQACSVALAFRPAGMRESSGVLEVTGTEPGSSAMVTLSGMTDGAVVPLQPVPARWDVQTRSGQTAQAVMAWVNRGRRNFVLDKVSLVGEHADSWMVETTSECRSGIVIPPLGSCLLKVRHTPRPSGTSKAVVVLSAAEGIAAQAELFGRAASDGPEVPMIDAFELSFNDSTMDTVPSLANQRLLTVSFPNVPGSVRTTAVVSGDHASDFSLTGTCLEDPPAPNGSDNCTVAAAFVPSASGARRATLTLQHHPLGPAAMVTLRGAATAEGYARLLTHPSVLEWSADVVPLSASSRRTIDLYNDGNKGSGPPRFKVAGAFQVAAVSGPCLAGLPPKGRCSIQVEPTGPFAGDAAGNLTIESDGAFPVSVPLRLSAGAKPATSLSWQTPPPVPTHGTSSVGGEPQISSSWRVVNSGTSTGTLSMFFSGPHPAEFSVDTQSQCQEGLSLAPGSACELRVRFHPGAPGVRTATLTLAAGSTAASVPLQGVGRAGAQAVIVSPFPSALSYSATPSGAAQTQLVYWRNESTSIAEVTAIDVNTPDFSIGGGSCPTPPFAMGPADGCWIELRWSGSPAGRFGGTLAVLTGTESTNAGNQVRLSVYEDPSLRSNVGGGRLGVFMVLSLGLAIGLLILSRRGQAC